MKLKRQAAQNKTKTSTPLFDQPPDMSWNAKTKTITLRVKNVPHENASNKTHYDYFLSVSLDELKGIIDCIAK